VPKVIRTAVTPTRTWFRLMPARRSNEVIGVTRSRRTAPVSTSRATVMAARKMSRVTDRMRSPGT
jgi:hypothetical protein